MEENFDNIEKKYIIQCKKCEHKFLPWKCLMVTLPKNNMQPYVYCPQCGNYDSLDNFMII